MVPYSCFNGEKDFHFGVSGGPFISAPYNWEAGGQSAQNQIDFTKSMAMITTRMNVTPINDQGVLFSSEREEMLELITGLARNQGVVILPIIPGRYEVNRLWESSAAESFQYGYNIANGFVNTYGHLFPYKLYELSNEIEIFWNLLRIVDDNGDIIPPPRNRGPGTAEGHFNLRFDNAIQYIAGMEAGVKAADPEAKTLFDCAGAATYLMDSVFGTGPFFWGDNPRIGVAPTIDYVAWHWYNNNQGAWENNSGFPGQYIADDIVEYLWLRYGKEIWFTETNYRFRTTNSQEVNEQNQVNWFEKFYSMCKSYPYVKGYYIFQLFDRDGSSFQENNFGLFKFEGSGWGNPVPKQLAIMLQTLRE